MAPVRVFHISPECCGQARIAQLFRRSGHQVTAHEKGALAEDITYCEAADEAPLQRWPQTCLFTGLYRHGPIWRPPLEGWRSVAFLRRHFPEAIFILTTREAERWLLDRVAHAEGMGLRNHAHFHDISPEQVLERWHEDWPAHCAAVRDLFQGDPRLIEIDLDLQTPRDLCARLSQFLPIIVPAHDHWGPPEEALSLTLMDRLLEAAGPVASPDSDVLAREIAAFCLKGSSGGAPVTKTNDFRGLSPLYREWDGQQRIISASGQDGDLRIGQLPSMNRPVAMAKGLGRAKEGRAEGVINSVLALGRRQPLRMDMEDSRWFGTPQGQMLSGPVLCHNRRRDAENAVLWPLPELHEIGGPGFDPRAGDDLPFEEKRDQVFWRGMISGHLITGEERPGPASFSLLKQLELAGDHPEARQRAWNRLLRSSRMAVVHRWRDHPDYDLGVVLAWAFRHFGEDKLLAPYCKPRANRNKMLQYRYQLYMAGYDHGSNFIPAINSRAVLLKEEDGWEVFYSGLFKPWKHYIPLARYCVDIAEKLAWARENPNKCKEMSEAARSVVLQLCDPGLRRATLGHILDGLLSPG